MTRTPLRKRRTKPRRGPARDRNYLAWIRGLPCLICFVNQWKAWLSRLNEDIFLWLANAWGVTPTWVEAAHTGPHGMGQKSSDYTAIPLCGNHHRTAHDSYHRMGRKFFEHHGIDRDALIRELNERYEEERAA